MELLNLFPRTLPPLSQSAEAGFVRGIAGTCYKARSKEFVWQWAEREVWIGGKMASRARKYDSSFTPWTREIQELPMRPGVREAHVVKSSRTGFSTACDNIMTWMPENWPGNALYSINSRDKAREVCERRIMPRLQANAAAQLTDDPDDATLSKISLKNMDIVVAGSGSPSAFMETWYRLIVLDEFENHEQNQDTTTYHRAKSRQSDVADGLILVISKPECVGTTHDQNYVRGTQKKFMVPCPRCGDRIELQTKFLVSNHCKLEDGSWDLDRVLRETYYQCQLCQGKIEEHEKYAMCDAGIWIPTPREQRRRPDSGQYMPPEPGVESYQIGDLYSNFERTSWGELEKMRLIAFVISPDEAAQKYFRMNHEGLPYQKGEASALTTDHIDALVAGRVEQTKLMLEDGTEKIINETIGVRFHLCYIKGKFNGRIPFRPALITVTVDKQFSFLKYLVFAWAPDGEAWLIDLGVLQDEDELIDSLRVRPYLVLGRDKPEYIFSGLIDCGHRRDTVYRACIRAQQISDAIHPSGWTLHPSRGEGEHEEYKGKNMRLMKDSIDGYDLYVRYYYDHGVKCTFYHSKIQRREAPRLWLPADIPPALKSEWTAEVFDEDEDKWVHEKTKRGPNDWGDTGKMQYVMFMEMREDLKYLPLPDPACDTEATCV